MRSAERVFNDVRRAMYVYAKITDNRLTLEAHPDLSTLGDNTRDRLAHITTVNGSASARFASDHPSSRFPAVAQLQDGGVRVARARDRRCGERAKRRACSLCPTRQARVKEWSA